MFRLLNNLRKKDWLLVIISFLLIVGQVWLDLKLPDYMSKITILVQTSGSKISDVLLNGFYMLLCAVSSLLLAFLVGYFISKVSSTLSMRIRKKIFTKVENLSMNEIKSFSTSSLITRTTNDITQIQRFFSMGLQLLIKAPITAIWAVTKILNKNLEWSLMTAVAVVILMIIVITLMIVVIPKFKIIQELTDKLNGVTRENLSGIRVVRAFNAEKYEESKFDSINTKLTKTQIFSQRAFSIMSPFMYLTMNVLTLSIYFVGASLISKASLPDKLILFSNMIVFSSYALQVIMSFLMLAVIFVLLPRTQVSAGRINEVLNKESSIKDGNVRSSKKDGTIDFRNVSFKYPDADEYVLKDINLLIKKGETVAFIGSTGSGKSTLVNLIPRFYDVTEGEILVDGINIKDYKLEDLYNKIGYVSQKAIIFSGTVSSNVTLGRKKRITEDKIKEAIKVSQSEDFVLKMDDKYNSFISQSGTNISGGQKQRLSIARAIARHPEIYIFDDSFSALDYKTDSLLRKELRKYAKDSTVLIVAQRIGTVMNADKIVVLDNGECVGIGTHKELLKKCSVYKEIALSQLSKEEL